MSNITDHIRTSNLEALEAAITSNPEVVNQPDERGFTPLVLATYLNQKAVTELLLDHSADINAQDAMMGNTALMGVCFKGSYELAKLLVDKGADTTLKNNQGETALDFAKKGKFEEIVGLLT